MDTHELEELNLTRYFAFANLPNPCQETSKGFLLTERAEIWSGKYLIYGLIGTLITLLSPLILLFREPLISFLPYFLFLGVSIFFTIKIFIKSSFFADVKRSIFASYYLLEGELIFSSYPLNLGGEYVLNFRRRLRKEQKTQNPGQLILSVVCVERVQHQKGTDIETKTHTVWQSQDIVRDVPAGVSSLSLETAFTLPSQLPPSFEAGNNQVRWIASVEQNVPGIANQVYSYFTLVVDPVVVA